MLGRSGSWVGGNTGGTTYSGNTNTMFATTGSPGQTFMNTSYNNQVFDWAIDRWLPRQPIDGRIGFYLRDAFTGTDRIGDIDWQQGGTFTPTAGSSTAAGVYTLTVSALSSISYLTQQLNSIQLGVMDVYCEAILSINTLSTASDVISFAFGMNDNVSYHGSSAATDGAYLLYNVNQNSSFWTAATASNGSITLRNSSSLITVGALTRLGIFASAGNANVSYYVGGQQICSPITTNIPTGAGRQTGFTFKGDKPLGSGALTVTVDDFMAWGFYNGANS